MIAHRRTAILAAIAGLFGLFLEASVASAASERSALAAVDTTDKVPEQTEPVRSADGYRLQDLDDPLQPLLPAKPRSVEDETRADALAWYMTGRFREQRNDFRGAMEAYKKAVERNPEASEAYRSLVPLAFGTNRTEDATKYAMKAIELFPDDHNLLRRLGVFMATQKKLPESVQLLEKAKASPKLEKDTAFYVVLMRDLAVMYGLVGRTNDAADCYTVVYDALLNGEKYNLDRRTRAALLGDPSVTFERIGQAFLDAERPDEAVAAFEQAAKARKGKPGSLSFNLAKVYLQTNQLEKSLEQLQTYFDAQLQSKGRDAYQLLADILKKLDQEDELIPRLEKLAEKDVRNSTLQFFLADQYADADRLAEAEALYKKTLAFSDDTEGYLGLATVYRRQHKPMELISNLAAALTKSGSLETLQTEMKVIIEDDNLLDEVVASGLKVADAQPPQLDFASSYLLAGLAALGEKTESAVRFYKVALSVRKNRELLARFADDLDDFARSVMLGGDYASAADLLQAASNDSALQPMKINFLFMLSQAREMNGETELALAAIDQALRGTNHPQLFFQQAWIYYHSEQWDEAVRHFEQLVAKFPQENDLVRRTQFLISNIHVQQGDIRKGEEILEAILVQDPDDPSVNNDLGYLYADQGKNLEKAETMIRKAIAAEPENPAYLDSMGWILYKLDRFEEAAPYLEKAVEKVTGGDATILDHLGDCYDRLQRPADAKDAWTKALKSARDDKKPDKSLIERLEEKLKNQAKDAGKLRPERPDSP